eukprot:486473_1
MSNRLKRNLDEGIVDNTPPIKKRKLNHRITPINYFNLCIRSLTGLTIVLANVHSNYSIWRIKEYIQQKRGYPPEQQRLIFSRTQLDDDRRLMDYNIGQTAIVFLILRPRGS